MQHFPFDSETESFIARGAIRAERPLFDREDAQLAELALNEPVIRSPRSLARMMSPILAEDTVSTLRALYVDRDLRLRATNCVRLINNDNVFVSPSYFFARASSYKASGLVLIQNFPNARNANRHMSKQLTAKFLQSEGDWNIGLFDSYFVCGSSWESLNFCTVIEAV